MSKRQKGIILLAGGTLAFALVWALFAKRDREPSYQGRTLSQWVDQWQQRTYNDAEAQTAIRAMGTNPIPTILGWISYQSSPFRKKLTMLLGRFAPGLRRSFINNGEQRASDAMDVFVVLGPKARVAIPELTRLAQTSSDPERASRCAQVLSYLGLDALPSVLLLMTNSPPATRRMATSALPNFGTNAAGAVPVLIQILEDKNPLNAIQAVDILSGLRLDSSILFAALTNALQSRSAIVRERAILRVLRVQPPTSEAVPALLPMLEDPDHNVRLSTEQVLRKIAPEVFTNELLRSAPAALTNSQPH